MKRFHAESFTARGNRGRARRKSNEKCEKEDKKKEWQWEEDIALNEAAVVWRKNWKIVSKEINKQFGKLHKTAEDCRIRFEHLQRQREEESWSPNEDLILVCACYFSSCNWTTVAESISNKDVQDIVRRFSGFVLETAQRAKHKHFICLRTMTPLCVLKALYSIKLLLNCIRSPEDGVPEVLSIVQDLNLNEEECLALMGSLVSPQQISRPHWTPEQLESHLENLMEHLHNNLANLNPNFSLDDIIHTRENVVEVAQAFAPIVYWMPVCLYAYPLYCVSFSYVDLLM